MVTIIGLSGSLRAGSFNAALLRAAKALAPGEAAVEIASIRGIPLYDGDGEAADGVPPDVAALKDRIAAADGLLLVTPEYNNSIPGVFKNAVDWLSRPASDIARVFRDKPVAIMGATPGKGGTILAQAAWLPVLRTLGTRPWFGPRLAISGAKTVFGPAGELQDDTVREQVQKFMDGYVKFIKSALVFAIVVMGGGSLRAQAPSALERELLGVVQGLADAQRTFDQKAMDRLLADDYIEVSPVGDVDTRDEVLGFYAPEARGKGPQPSSVVLDEPSIRVHGDHAVVIVRETINIDAGGTPRAVTLRVTAQLRRQANAWRIASVQYTPVPPPRK
ncbi:MAG: NAD(P)H-dependent oxidoreductase [Vicinamibacterales bacterium]